MINISLWDIILCLFFVSKVQLLDNGLALTPPMGWMSWGYYMCNEDCELDPRKCLNEKLILSVADAFNLQGYQDVGFEYIIIDDCWSEKYRDENGKLVANKERFPNGMKYIADYIHSRGLKFGMYTNIAKVTCMLYPGSKDYFEKDAETFADWGVDYLKVDGCFVPKENLNNDYIRLGHYLNKTGRPIVYSCSWPYYIEYIHHRKPNYPKIATYCNLWRNYHDVTKSWPAILNIIRYYEKNYNIFSGFHGPGHWNDPDMLIIGTGALSEAQSRIHLVVYAMLSAPLLLSCDMDMITNYERELLLNEEITTIAQDPLGIMAKPHSFGPYVTLWVKEHLPKKGNRYSSYSFALVSLQPSAVYPISFAPSHYGLNNPDGYTVMNVFTKNFERNISLYESLTVSLSYEDVVLYKLFPL